MANLPYDSVRDLAIAIQKRRFSDFKLLPYNRFDVSHSNLVWLSPTSDNPGYAFGKVVVSSDDPWPGSGTFFCGYNVEKGLLNKLAGRSNQQMNGSWYWHRFLKNAGTPLADLIESAKTASGLDLQIYVASGPMSDFNAWNRVLFDVDGHSLTATGVTDAPDILTDLSQCTDITQFETELNNLSGTSGSFYWVDVLIGACFSKDKAGSDDMDQCTAILETFEPWMPASW